MSSLPVMGAAAERSPPFNACRLDASRPLARLQPRLCIPLHVLELADRLVDLAAHAPQLCQPAFNLLQAVAILLSVLPPGPVVCEILGDLIERKAQPAEFLDQGQPGMVAIVVDPRAAGPLWVEQPTHLVEAQRLRCQAELTRELRDRLKLCPIRQH